MAEQINNINFVTEVEKHPVLYNYNLTGYSLKCITEEAWSEVGREVQLTVSECKEKWKNLRAVFVRHMKPASNGAGSKKKKPYYLADAMQFTVPYIKTLTPPTGNLHNVPQEEDQLSNDIDTEENVSVEDFKPSAQSHSLPSSSFATPVIPQEDERQSQSISGTRQKRKHALNYEESNRRFFEYAVRKKVRIADTSGHSTNQNRKNEAAKMFLLSMLPDLELMTDEQIRRFKLKSLQTIDDILCKDSYPPNLPFYPSPPNYFNTSTEPPTTRDIYNSVEYDSSD